MDELLVLTYRTPDPEIEKAWAEEARRRLEAHDRGETTPIPAEEAMAFSLSPWRISTGTQTTGEIG